MEVKLNRGLHGLAVFSLLSLIALCVGWELWWAPLHAGGSFMVLKAVPLLFAVRGVFKGSLYTMQWAALLSLLYLMEGVVRAWSDLSAVSAALAGLEIVLSLGLYGGAIFYVRPAKRAARQAAHHG